MTKRDDEEYLREVEEFSKQLGLASFICHWTSLTQIWQKSMDSSHHMSQPKKNRVARHSDLTGPFSIANQVKKLSSMEKRLKIRVHLQASTCALWFAYTVGHGRFIV